MQPSSHRAGALSEEEQCKKACFLPRKEPARRRPSDSPHQEPNRLHTDLKPPASRSVRKKCLLYEPPRPWYLVRQPQQTKEAQTLLPLSPGHTCSLGSTLMGSPAKGVRKLVQRRYPPCRWQTWVSQGSHQWCDLDQVSDALDVLSPDPPISQGQPRGAVPYVGNSHAGFYPVPRARPLPTVVAHPQLSRTS